MEPNLLRTRAVFTRWYWDCSSTRCLRIPVPQMACQHQSGYGRSRHQGRTHHTWWAIQFDARGTPSSSEDHPITICNQDQQCKTRSTANGTRWQSRQIHFWLHNVHSLKMSTFLAMKVHWVKSSTNWAFRPSSGWTPSRMHRWFWTCLRLWTRSIKNQLHYIG